MPPGLWVRALCVWLGLFLAGLGLAMAGEDMQAQAQFEARVRALSSQLRCVACEGMGVVDQRDSLALELQRELRGLVAQGRSDSQVVEALIARYGDFVRYRPADDGDALVWGFMLMCMVVSAGLVVLLVHHDQPSTLLTDSGLEERPR